MLLELREIAKSFGGLRVLSDVSFKIKQGDIVGLIGPNGAGKTTLFNLITGIFRPDSGAIQFQGRDLIGTKPHRICRQGIARTFQLVRIFPSMTVLENVMAGAIYGNRRSKSQARIEALQYLELLGLAEVAESTCSRLTLSDRRLVEIARALAAKPSLALLDEPLAGLNPTETNRIMKLIREIRETHGVSILWIEHKIDAVFSICDHIVVLDYGTKLAEGIPVDIAADKRVVEAYLGEPLD